MKYFLFSSAALLAIRVAVAAGSGEEVDFNRDIRPILSDHCFACHGPDGNKRKAELRLDLREGLFGKGESGEPVIVPGDIEKSELVRRISAGDPEEVMPPPKAHKELRPAQIDLLKRWVRDGARWAGHWAFESIRATSPPANGAPTPIDALVRARLTK